MLSKKFVILTAALTVIFASFLLFLFIRSSGKKPIAPSESKEPRQETLAEKQLKELDVLRNKAEVGPLTEAQKQAQIKELSGLRKEAKSKLLTETQVQKQLEELDKLRLAQ